MQNFHEQSKVWIYQSNRSFTDIEVNDINLALRHFCKEWTAHGSNLKASGEIRFNRFIVLMVDETAAGASGCSIDKSVHFIKAIEQEYAIELFNRLLFAWKKGEKIHVSHLNELQTLVDSGEMNSETMIFNNAITSKKELDEKWMVPLNQSWMYRRLRSIGETNVSVNQ